MDIQALLAYAKTKIVEAQGVIVKFSQDMLDSPYSTLRFSRPVFEATARLMTWNGILAALNSGNSVEDVAPELLYFTGQL